MYDCEIGRAMNDEVMRMKIDDSCAVCGCNEPAIEVSYQKWNKDHPRCTPVALCQKHYDSY